MSSKKSLIELSGSDLRFENIYLKSL